jgi:hypothetical protein
MDECLIGNSRAHLDECKQTINNLILKPNVESYCYYMTQTILLAIGDPCCNIMTMFNSILFLNASHQRATTPSSQPITYSPHNKLCCQPPTYTPLRAPNILLQPFLSFHVTGNVFLRLAIIPAKTFRYDFRQYLPNLPRHIRTPTDVQGRTVLK